MKRKRLDPLSFFVPLLLTGAILLGTQTRSDAQLVWMESNAVWKYNQAGTVPPNDGGGRQWNETGYDDSGWSQGPAELGFGDSNPAQTTTLVRGKITYYFRHTLNVTQSQIDTYNQLVLEMIRDDGAVVYINGVEVRRDNMADGVVNSNTLANATVGGGDETRYYKTVHNTASVFNAGPNTVAVEIHQASTSSSDISLQMLMTGFEVVPVLGIYTPPAFIDFEEPGDGADLFDPDPLFFEEEFKELGWYSNPTGNFTFVKRVHTTSGAPGPQGFTEGFGYVVADGSMVMETDIFLSGHPLDIEPEYYRVNLTNYKDVKVQFDLRAWDGTGNGMHSSDYARFTMYTSVDGSNPVEEMLLNLEGSGNAGGGSNTVIVPFDAMKSVTVPTDDSLGQNWHLVGFDDADWIHSDLGAGYESSSSGTYDPYFGENFELEAEMRAKNGTLFMRVPFTLDEDPGTLLGLTLAMRYDDGYVAYINGHEVARKNGPSNGSEGVPPAWNAEAGRTHSDNLAQVFEEVSISQHLDKLVMGQNMLAIHGLNQPKGSSDMLIQPELRGKVIGEPVVLDDIIRENVDGPFTTFCYDVPDEMNSVWMKWEIRVRDSNQGPLTNNIVVLDNILVSGTPLTADTFRNWIFLTTEFEIDDLGAPGADPDGDGCPNALEYAFGGDATVPDNDLKPTAEIITLENGNRHLALTWQQRNATTTGGLDGVDGGSFKVRDIRYIPQFSTDGINWRDGFLGGGDTAVQVGEIEGEGDTVPVTAYFIDPIDASTERLFGRVKIEIDEFLFDDL